MDQDLAQTHEAHAHDICERLADLAGSRWETHILLRLSEAPGPPRRIALKSAINRAAGEAVPDNTLDRILGRLVEQSLVRWRVDEEYHKLYGLTDAGRRRAAQLRQLLQVLSDQ